MNTLYQLEKKVWFWFVLIQSYIGTLCLVGATVWYINHYATEKWVSLPPLPKGETAKEIIEMYVHREIHVITDQGNYYGCSYLNEKRCWFPIAREVNHYKSRFPWMIGEMYPPPPPGTRQLVAELYDLDALSIDGHSIHFASIIRADGQVAFWDDTGNWGAPLYADGFCLGIFFLFLVLSYLILIACLGKKQKKRSLPLA